MRSAGILVLCAAFLLPAAPAPGGDRDGDGSPGPEAAKSPARRVTREQQDAIDSGLAWLAKQQAPDGGFPTSEPGGGGPAKNADYRTAVTLCDVEGFSYDRIAEIMACPLGTVRSRIHRGRILFRKNFEKVQEEGDVR